MRGILSRVLLTLLFLGTVMPAQAAPLCSRVFHESIPHFVRGQDRLRTLMKSDLAAKKKEILSQDLRMFQARQQKNFANTIFFQFVGNSKINRVIKDSMIPDFLSADMIELTSQFFAQHPDQGAIVHYNYRDVVVKTNLTLPQFQKQFEDFILSQVASRYQTSQMEPDSVLSKEWIMEHIRWGIGKNMESAFFQMKLGSRDLRQVHLKAYQLRARMMALAKAHGIDRVELVRFLRYDLPDEGRTHQWLHRFHFPKDQVSALRELRDAYFLYDFLPSAKISEAELQEAQRLLQANEIDAAVDLLRKKGAAPWRLQRISALDHYEKMSEGLVMSTDQRRLGLVNFLLIDQVLAAAEPPRVLAQRDIPNSRGLFQQHLWIKNKIEQILESPGSVDFWLIGDDATWILPAMTEIQKKQVTQFLDHNRTLYYTLNEARDLNLENRRADVLSDGRQEVVNEKKPAGPGIGWPIGRVFDVSFQDGKYFVNGIGARRIGDAWGNQNEGIYVYNINGSERLLKILKLDFAQDLAKQYGNQTSVPELEIGLLNREFNGAYRGDKMGGPHLHNVGLVNLPDGTQKFFIEMENIFAGTPSKTLKTFLRDANGDLSLLEKSIGSRQSYVQQMAKMVVKAYEDGMVPNDPDFIFSNGLIRWIDTGLWEPVDSKIHPLIPAARFPPGLRIYLRLKDAGSAATAEFFKNEFVRAVQRSRVIPATLKTQLIDGMKMGPEAQLPKAG